MNIRVLILATVATFAATSALSVSMGRDIYPLQRDVASLKMQIKSLEARILVLEKEIDR